MWPYLSTLAGRASVLMAPKNEPYEAEDDLREIDHAEEEARRWQQGGDRPQELWLASRAKKVLLVLEQFGKHPSPELRRFLRPQEVLIAQLDKDQLSHRDRLLIGQKLTEFGDTRPGVGVKDGLPDIVWIEIPGGQVTLKSIKREFQVKPFKIAKYPVTNEQFEVFLNAEDGYKNEKWWEDMEQCQEAAQPRWREANCPRETVSWYEAVAFCRWLSDKTGTSVRLPSEVEWQQAATGGNPQGEYPRATGRWCTSSGSDLDRTIAVGMNPQEATPQGVLDIDGNVYNWCVNWCDDYNGTGMLRGGSWHDDGPDLLSGSFRLEPYAYLRDWLVGFRLVQDLP
jgi:hypothetical protein